MLHLKAIPENHPKRRFCVWDHRLKMYLKKFRGSSAPLALPGSAYDTANQIDN